MKFNVSFVLMFLYVTFLTVVPLKGNSSEITHESQTASFFDDLEDQALKINAFDNVVHTRPHALMIWMRIIGSPILNAYVVATNKLHTSWLWLVNHLTFKASHAKQRSSETSVCPLS